MVLPRPLELPVGKRMGNIARQDTAPEMVERDPVPETTLGPRSANRAGSRAASSVGLALMKVDPSASPHRSGRQGTLEIEEIVALSPSAGVGGASAIHRSGVHSSALDNASVGASD
jgi:hypothetical protein